MKTLQNDGHLCETLMLAHLFDPEYIWDHVQKIDAGGYVCRLLFPVIPQDLNAHNQVRTMVPVTVQFFPGLIKPPSRFPEIPAVSGLVKRAPFC